MIDQAPKQWLLQEIVSAHLLQLGAWRSFGCVGYTCAAHHIFDHVYRSATAAEMFSQTTVGVTALPKIRRLHAKKLNQSMTNDKAISMYSVRGVCTTLLSPSMDDHFPAL